MSSRPTSTRSLPQNPSLAQLRKQAKELLKSFRAGEEGALAEVARFERRPDHAGFTLADAQRVLARAYGYSSWTNLKGHVEGATAAAFRAAVEAGEADAVRRLARARPKLVQAEWRGQPWPTALHFAVATRNAETTRALMELGADARTGLWPHRDATTAHTIAKERGYEEIAAIIEQQEELRRMKLSPHDASLDSRIDDVHKAILRGRHDEAVRILESDSSLVSACNVDRGLNDVDGRRFALGATPLHIAAWVHSPEMAAWLLDRHAHVDARDVEGRTPLDYAATVAGWSAHGRDFCFMENSRKDPALFDATVRLLRSRGAELTPRAAVAIGDREAIRRIHRLGRLNNEVGSVRGGLLSIAVRVNRRDMASLLLELGVDPDESFVEDGRRVWGMPLWFCAMAGRHEIAELLLAHAADVNAVVDACGDALSIADETGDGEMQALLLRHGARLTVERVAGSKDRVAARAILDGTMPAQSLNVDEPSHTDLAEQMLWAAGDADPEIVRMCLPHVDRPRDDPWWNYVLMHATLPESFKLVLEHGVDPDVAGEGGYTMLHHLATPHGGGSHRVALATMLLDAGATLATRDPRLCSTPLGWACRWGRLDLVQLYLSRGADASERLAEPWATPLAWAARGNHREILELLHARGVS